MIDVRLEDCSSEIEIAENFDRTLALVDANAADIATNTGDISTNTTGLSALRGEIPVRTVTFNSDGGSAVEAQTVFYGGVAVEPEDPTKTDKTFGGWNLSESAYDFATAVTVDITLIAQWT